jgi:hypothetical protein
MLIDSTLITFDTFYPSRDTCDRIECFQEAVISRPISWESEDMVEELLRDALSELKLQCEEYLSITSKHFYQEEYNELDQMRLDFCRKEVVNNTQRM